MTDHQILVEEESTEHLNSTPLIISLILLICLAGFIRWNLNPSNEITPAEQNTHFSAVSAKQMLSSILADEIPHPVDSIEIRQTEKRLVNILRGLGYQEEIQEERICDDNQNRGVRCTQVRNIIVTINGEDTNLINDKPTGILISSHYDSVDAGPGASDAGVAVATMLEIARLLSTMPQPKNTIVLLFNEGEEYGLFGAKAFMQKHPLAKKLKLAINIEARGSKGSSVMFETGEDSGWLVQEYLKQSPKVFSSSLFYEVYKSLPNDTDLTVVKNHGLQGLNFAHAENLTHYHTPLDNLVNLELATIQHHGDNVWGVLKNIKDINLNDESLAEVNLVYTDILGLFSLEWQESTSLTISVFLLLLLVFGFSRISKTIMLSKKSMRRGVYAFFITLILLPVIAYILQLGITSLSTTNQPWLINSFPMQLALWSLLTLMTLLGGRFLLKNCQPLSVLLGQVSCWIILSIASSYFIVGISYLFIIPSIISVIIIFMFPYFSNVTNQSKIQLHYVVIALAAAIMFLPIVYTLEIMVTYQMTVALGVMFSFVMIGLLPMLSFSKKVNLKKINLTLLVSFLIGFTWTVFQPSFDQVSKQRINLYYLQDDKENAYIVAGHKNNQPSDALRKELDSPTLDAILPWSNFKLFSKKIVHQNIRPSQATISKASNDEKPNDIKILINSSNSKRELREVRIYVPKKSNIKSVTFLNKQYDLTQMKKNSKGYVDFRCIGLNCQTLKVDFEKTSADKVEILIIKTLKGLPDDLEHFKINRGNTAHQSQFGDQSYIVSRLEI